MTVMSMDQLARLMSEYPDTPDDELAARYGITPGALDRIARKNQLRKAHHDRAAAARKGHDGRRPADLPDPRPTRPRPASGDYCGRCGQANHHWPGCPNLGTDHRPLLPLPEV